MSWKESFFFLGESFSRPGSLSSFALIYASYIFFYLNKKNYSLWLMALVSAGTPMQSAAMFGSIMESVYGVGKMLGGPFVDAQPSPARVLYGALMICACANALMFCPLFPEAAHPYVDWTAWAVNALAQAVAWPALAQIFLNWFKESPYRGTLYAILSTNQSIGSTMPAIVLLPLMDAYGYRAAFYVPAVAGAFAAIALAAFLRDGPAVAASKCRPKKQDGGSPMDILKSWKAYALGAGYMFLTVIRVGVADWILVLLQDVHGISPDRAKPCILALEIGSFVGGLAAGYVSDKLFRGRRAPCIIIACLATAPLAFFLASSAANSSFISLRAVFFAFGLVSFGPHMLIGLLAREIFPAAPSSAGSFVKGMGQLGGALAGVPTSALVAALGWNAAALAWGAAGVLAAACFAPLVIASDAQKLKAQ